MAEYSSRNMGPILLREGEGRGEMGGEGMGRAQKNFLATPVILGYIVANKVNKNLSNKIVGARRQFRGQFFVQF